MIAPTAPCLDGGTPVALLAVLAPGADVRWLGLVLVVIGSLAAGAVYLFYVTRRMKRKIGTLRSQRDHFRTEERRVFDFLHELGEAFSGDLRPADLHRRIVEGAVKILEAKGGALYLADKSDALLAPMFITKGCPPLVEVPTDLPGQASAQTNDSYFRLHHIRRGEGIIGQAWSKGAGPASPGSEFETTSAARTTLAAPLNYGGHRLGVLVVANGPGGEEFYQSDATVFQAIAEQSAFALYSAIMFAEANDKKRLDHDLQVARDIQKILLPSSSPDVPGFLIAGVNLPASSVSGDYFDYVAVDQDRVGVAIADVSGKGIPASLIMAMCRSVLRGAARGQQSPAEVLREVNRQLFPDIKEDMFISAAYVLVNHVTGSMTLARAGHDAPLLYVAAAKTVTALRPPGMALGIDSGGVFDRVLQDHSLKLDKGDCLVLYTDGVTEALDAAGSEYGIDNMVQAIRESASNGPTAVLQRLTDELQSFVGGHPQHDDITLIAISKT
jgi:sigma-B regulation protein RsbU (phosphoserine phosphatase)